MSAEAYQKSSRITRELVRRSLVFGQAIKQSGHIEQAERLGDEDTDRRGAAALSTVPVFDGSSGCAESGGKLDLGEACLRTEIAKREVRGVPQVAEMHNDLGGIGILAKDGACRPLGNVCIAVLSSLSFAEEHMQDLIMCHVFILSGLRTKPHRGDPVRLRLWV